MKPSLLFHSRCKSTFIWVPSTMCFCLWNYCAMFHLSLDEQRLSSVLLALLKATSSHSWRSMQLSFLLSALCATSTMVQSSLNSPHCPFLVLPYLWCWWVTCKRSTRWPRWMKHYLSSCSLLSSPLCSSSWWICSSHSSLTRTPRASVSMTMCKSHWRKNLRRGIGL